MNENRMQRIHSALEAGEIPEVPDARESELDDAMIQKALSNTSGRRWLRDLGDLSQDLADRLIGYREDFETSRRDSSLDRVIQRASTRELVDHQAALAGSPAASAFWTRVAEDMDQLIRIATVIASGTNARAAESTLYLLVLDPIDPFNIGEDARVEIASAGLLSAATSVRSLAAEYLYDHRPEYLAETYESLIRDDDERIRGLGWSAGLRVETAEAMRLATMILDDESVRLDIRRSALAALGTNFSTADVVDILAEQVLNSELDLALDAANLLYRLHRHPVIATAAARSPHQQVREIGEFLLDPYRGSPAAGGSRPGDPTRSDIFAEMIRQTEERMLDDMPENESDEP